MRDGLVLMHAGERVISRVTEAHVAEGLSLSETIEAVREALSEKFGADGTWIWPRDVDVDTVVYELENATGCETYRVGYTIDDAGTVTISDDAPTKVEVRTEFVPVKESRSIVTAGRVLERTAPDGEGPRIFRMRMIDAGTSRNGYRYPARVLEAAATLYEGAKAFDHHRTLAELSSSSIAGLAGYWRNVEAAPDGLDGDLVLLPSAQHVAEALDMSYLAQQDGLPPTIGVSHDVQMLHEPAQEGGRTVREAVEIIAVLSTDVVADPSAGGRVTRVVAGGFGSETPTKETSMTLKELLDLLRGAKSEDRAALLSEHEAVLTAAGFTAEDVPTLIGETSETTTETTSEETTETQEPVLAGAQESYQRGTLGAGMIVREAVRSAGLPEEFEQLVAADLPERFTEADIVSRVAIVQRVTESQERRGLGRQSVTGSQVAVGSEHSDKQVERLAATFRGDFQGGFSRISEAYTAITGLPYRPVDQAFAAEMIRESWQGPGITGARVTESLDTTSWGQVLADVMHKRIVELYQGSKWMDWTKLATTFPVPDFRDQKLIQVGEFASLPTVSEGAPYQALTSPGDVQETYNVDKRGGTEDYTFEMAKNDDLRALVTIPQRLARIAAYTLYATIFDGIVANPTLSQDSTALFHADHGNTGTTALSQAGLATTRQKMRDQAAYGDTDRKLGLIQKYLLVPNELEELAYQLATSNVAVPSTPAGPSDTPNIHRGLEPIVVDRWTDATDWYTTCDPADHPLIEVGFLDGKQDPELFVQDDPTSGSAFSADKVTWKLRHTWGYSVVDFRGFQRMVVAG